MNLGTLEVLPSIDYHAAALSPPCDLQMSLGSYCCSIWTCSYNLGCCCTRCKMQLPPSDSKCHLTILLKNYFGICGCSPIKTVVWTSRELHDTAVLPPFYDSKRVQKTPKICWPVTNPLVTQLNLIANLLPTEGTWTNNTLTVASIYIYGLTIL